jgi:hypothetical protein
VAEDRCESTFSPTAADQAGLSGEMRSEATAGNNGALGGRGTPASICCVRATDATGKTQPLDSEEVWNQDGYGINVVRRVLVEVG